MIPISEIEKVIRNIEEFQKACEESGFTDAINACDYCISELKELLPKNEA